MNNDENSLSESDRFEVANILTRRSNEIAGFADAYRNDPKHFGSVEMALSREIDRLRSLADRVKNATPLPGTSK
ncbi:hypothetical protein RD110_11085 [Rhodoferax koreense]|uniref:Uncharacterized protein n=1 Tax=Rhodoferax koreensis TaxID=1842727 RepID=A0A1P8JVG0_9BURK|nr:hypothetical protein [Rhodoferax koreense]APW37671.1 hypothetical protein RD110_11085 [Rhodoferax koreense]